MLKELEIQLKKMNIIKRIKSFFSIRGVLYVFTRFGWSSLRGLAFDENYIQGNWDYLETEHNREIVSVIEKYAMRGSILDMGCGTGVIASMINCSNFEKYVGVDVSGEAIVRAKQRCIEKADFVTGDIKSYKTDEKFNLLVFEESLYYVPFFRRRLLNRYCRYLRPGGCFLVTVSDPVRFKGMVSMIRKNFNIVEDRCFENSDRLLLVFGPKTTSRMPQSHINRVAVD